jgi:1,4-dihydroxy-6-naphthoate synthase
MSAVCPLRIGLSTCPNDTFLFHGLLAGAVDTRGLPLEFLLADVQDLNERLARGELDVGKASFATALELADRYGVLRVGSALGFGVGPVLLARPLLESERRPAPRVVLCPGAGTTATLLMRRLHPEVAELVQVRFDAIMPALARGEADAGVAIHEGRFTHREHGLVLLEDLGASWERLTGGPVPLGGLLARRDLGRTHGADVHARLCAALSDSLALARARPAEALATMRLHAQELADDVLWRHVELYVNAHTADLGATGARALAELARRTGRATQGDGELAILGEQT